MNPDKDLFDLLIELIEKVLGHPVSPLFEKALAGFFILAIIAIAANALIMGIKALINEVIIPVFYNKEQKRRRSRRQLFADHVEAEIRYLNSRESWNDNRFAELEAEVEAEGSRKLFGWIKINFGAGTRLRRERSLSTAISNSAVPLVLLEGDPGSGKSVALRHVAQQMARRAAKSRSLKSVVPLYINLKNLKRDEGKMIDRNFIGDFVLKSINRINDRDVDEFLKNEFQIGLEEGSWFFLFDSFDEIPEILSSTESDATIRVYAEAIRDFLHGMNKCKGIVASREYKGPRYLGWPKFRIAPLSAMRRTELINRTNLPLDIQQKIYAGISFAAVEFKSMTSNPMFLSLLCEFMQRENAEFPQHTHIVYEEYISKRLIHDEERIKTRFAKSPSELRIAAEKLAFCMTADGGLGLSPTLDSLRNSTEKLNLSLGEDFNTYVEALEYLKLARIDNQLGEREKLFTFAHRRFQEYFATAIVVKDSWRVSPKELLSNGQWRETAVTLLQTQSNDQLSEIIEIAELIFTSSLEGVDARFDNYEDKPSEETEKLPLLKRLGLGELFMRMFERSQVTNSWVENLLNEIQERENTEKRKQEVLESFSLPINWPQGVYHLLSILQDGTVGKSNLISTNFQSLINKYLNFICGIGSLDDKKMAIEVASIASSSVFIDILRVGFMTPGNWVKSVAYRQLARLRDVPKEFSAFIRGSLIAMMFNGRLFIERQEVYAQLARLDKSRQFINTARLLVWMPLIDHLLTILSLVIVVNSSLLSPSTSYTFAVLIVIYLVLRWHAKTFWQLGFNLSYNLTFPNVLSTPIGLAGFFMLVGIMVWYMLVEFGGMNNLFSFQISRSSQFSYALYYLIATVNVWSTIALSESFVGKRTHPVWWAIFIIYPLVIFPAIIAVVALEIIVLFGSMGDIVFFISRLPLIIRKLVQTNSLKINVVAHMINKYLALRMATFLLILMPIFLILSSSTVAIIYGAGILIFVLYMLYKTVSSLIKEKSELRLYDKERLGNSTLGLIEFVEFLQIFKSKAARNKIIKDAIDNRLINITQENEEHLRNLISFVQAVIGENLINHYTYLKTIDPLLASKLNLDDISERAPKKVVWDQDQLDQLCILLDQVRTNNVSK